MTNQQTIKIENEVRMKNEVSRERDVVQWKSNIDRGQISKESLY